MSLNRSRFHSLTPSSSLFTFLFAHTTYLSLSRARQTYFFMRSFSSCDYVQADECRNHIRSISKILQFFSLLFSDANPTVRFLTNKSTDLNSSSMYCWSFSRLLLTEIPVVLTFIDQLLVLLLLFGSSFVKQFFIIHITSVSILISILQILKLTSLLLRQTLSWFILK